MSPLVSVVIPNFNYGRFLGQAIDSVLRQTYPVVEVLVVDDGSTDNSASVGRRYGSRIRWLAQPHQGVAAARNRGIAESRGDLIAFLDSDDIWYSEKLAKQVPLMSRPEVGLVSCGLRYVDVAGRTLETSLPHQRGHLLREIALLRWRYAPGGSAALVRRSCLAREGGFDPRLSTSADWDLWRRIAGHYEFDGVCEPLVEYRQHPGSMRTDVRLFERDMLHAFAKMFDDPGAACVHNLRWRSYGRLYLTFAGAYLYAGQWSKSLTYALRSMLVWPPNGAALAAVPWRYARRAFS